MQFCCLSATSKAPSLRKYLFFGLWAFSMLHYNIALYKAVASPTRQHQRISWTARRIGLQTYVFLLVVKSILRRELLTKKLRGIFHFAWTGASPRNDDQWREQQLSNSSGLYTSRLPNCHERPEETKNNASNSTTTVRVRKHFSECHRNQDGSSRRQKKELRSLKETRSSPRSEGESGKGKLACLE